MVCLLCIENDDWTGAMGWPAQHQLSVRQSKANRMLLHRDIDYDGKLGLCKSVS